MAKPVWEVTEKPWDSIVTELRYVTGSRIGVHALAVESGNPINTIDEWSREHDWKKKREQYWNVLLIRNKQKSIKLLSDVSADRHARAATEHLEVLPTLREVTAEFMACILEVITAIDAGEDPSAHVSERLEFLCSLGGKPPLQPFSHALSLEVSTERSALFINLMMASLQCLQENHKVIQTEVHQQIKQKDEQISQLRQQIAEQKKQLIAMQKQLDTKLSALEKQIAAGQSGNHRAESPNKPQKWWFW